MWQYAWSLLNLLNLFLLANIYIIKHPIYQRNIAIKKTTAQTKELFQAINMGNSLTEIIHIQTFNLSYNRQQMYCIDPFERQEKLTDSYGPSSNFPTKPRRKRNEQNNVIPS